MIPLGVLAARRAATGGGVLSFLTSAHSTTDGTSFTFSGLSLGADTPGREIVFGMSWALAGRPSSITIGGASVALDVDTAGYEAVIGRATPSGITGDVVVNFTASVINCAVGLWYSTGPLTVADSFAGVLIDNPFTITPGQCILLGYTRDADLADSDYRYQTESEGARFMFHTGAHNDTGSFPYSLTSYNQSFAAVSYG